MVPATTTTTDGILQMRAEGMGWGQIAQKYMSNSVSSRAASSLRHDNYQYDEYHYDQQRHRYRCGKSSTTVTGTGMAGLSEANPRNGIVSASVKPPAHLLIT
jgi:hypothetical protein